jgi:hypothetical protein
MSACQTSAHAAAGPIRQIKQWWWLGWHGVVIMTRPKVMQLSLLLVFALFCGAVSVAVMWQLGTAFRDAVRAKSWAVLPAEVQLVRRADETHGVRPLVRYAYRVAGREYTSPRLGIAQINGAEGVGGWRE